MTPAELRAVAQEIEQQVYSLAQRIRQVAHQLDLDAAGKTRDTTTTVTREDARCQALNEGRQCRRYARHLGTHRFSAVGFAPFPFSP